ncbi:MAG: START domain-containing protein [Pseudomonadales bacterium]
MSRTGRESLCAIALLLLCGCAAMPDTGEALARDQVRITFEAVPTSAIPAFSATIRVKSSVSRIMSVLTDFGGWPQWVYRCQQVNILQSIGYTEAYIYQVTRLPIVRDREVILHAVILNQSPGQEVVINFEATPDYCDTSERLACEGMKTSKNVRVRELTGSFRIQQITPTEADITWRQHMDPGGNIPAWVVRLIQPNIPVHSLARLKQLVES